MPENEARYASAFDKSRQDYTDRSCPND